MPHLHEIVPDADVVIELDPEELGGILLQVFASRPPGAGGLHLGNYESEVFGRDPVYPRDRQEAVLQAVREAFVWLEAQVLLAPDANGQHGWRVLSRRGRRLAAPAA